MRLARGPVDFDEVSPAGVVALPEGVPCLFGLVLSVGFFRPVNSRSDFEPPFR